MTDGADRRHGETADEPGDPQPDDTLSSRSFLVRALLERNGGGTSPGWHGFVTDVATGERGPWRRASEVARFIQRRLAVSGPRAETRRGRPAVTAPTLTDVVTDMLAALATRLPPAVPAMPEPNVTVERVTERLVGLGNHGGTERTSALGTRTLRGGRLDARVRFQLWAASATAVDAAVLALHGDLLDDRDTLRQAGFLKLAATDTTLAEPVEAVGGWRKSTSFDVLYEYEYVDTDDADSLIASIRATTDLDRAGGPPREIQMVVDEMVRWDDETAPELVVAGPNRVARLSALAFVPGGVQLGGTVTVRRSVRGTSAAPTVVADLPAFLDAVGGSAAALTNAVVTMSPGELLTGLGPAGTPLELGDWDVDGAVDSYDSFDRLLARPIELMTGSDLFGISYAPPAGSGPGLDQTAVIYLRANAP